MICYSALLPEGGHFWQALQMPRKPLQYFHIYYLALFPDVSNILFQDTNPAIPQHIEWLLMHTALFVWFQSLKCHQRTSHNLYTSAWHFSASQEVLKPLSFLSLKVF